jgi:cell pole-organizing protein PopZ
MNKLDKATEPSMEEILASIRKIIAEEPIGSRPDPARHSPRPGPDQLAPLREQAASQGARPPAHPPETRHGPIAIDDALADLVEQPIAETGGATAKAPQEAPVPAVAAPAAATAAEPRQRQSWLFSRPHPIPNAAPTSMGQHDPSRAGGPPASVRDVLRSAERAESEPATVGDKPDAAADAAAALTASGRESAVAMALPEAGADHRAITARQVKLSGPGGRGVPSISSPESARSAPAVEPPTAEATSQLAYGSGAAVCGTQPHSNPGRKPDRAATGSPRPDALVPHRSDTVAPAGDWARSASVTGSLVRPVAEAVDTGAVAAHSALDALSQGLAAPAVTTAKASDGAAPGSQGAAQGSQAARTLEETVTELLRPMLRQWLDANMPNIVERALRVELADGAKPGGTTGLL